MSKKVIFETTGMRDATAGGLALVGAIVSLVFLIISIAIKGKFVGPFYIYAGTLVLCSYIVYSSAKKHAVKLEVIEGKGDELLFSLTGIANNIEFRVEQYNYWYTKKWRPKTGIDIRQHFLAIDAQGEKLCFTTLGGAGTEPKGWKEEKEEFPLGQKVFMMSKLPELAKVVNEHSRSHGG